jgi:hypothetical protein
MDNTIPLMKGPMSAQDLVKAVLRLKPLRPRHDWFEGESPSVICLDLLLNQRVGAERATAVNLAIHDHFRRPFSAEDRCLAEVCGWPYEGAILRPSARSVMNLVSRYFERTDWRSIPVKKLSSSVIGALASLDRYYNRTNPFFDPLRGGSLHPDLIRSLTCEQARRISGIKLPETNFQHQAASAAEILRMLPGDEQSGHDLKRRLLSLPRVGEETAMVMMVYLFGKRGVIVDEYLERILIRHGVLPHVPASKSQIRSLLESHIQTPDESRRFHARIDDIGVLFCFAREPNCEQCPLGW